MTDEPESGMTDKQRKAVEQFLADVKAVAELEQGQRLLAWIFDKGRLLSCCYTGNQTGTFMQGEQSLALQIFAAVAQVAPDVARGLLPVPMSGGRTLKELQAEANLVAVM